MSSQPIHDPAELVERLVEAKNDTSALRDVFECVGFGVEAIERHCHFDPRHYTRNLIARTSAFELLALCWEPGQVTPIHDHAGSDGWVRCMQGEIEEVQFHVSAEDGVAKVERGVSLRATAGQATHINDDIAWHTVGNPTSRRAVSLHLYAGPIESCRYVDSGGSVRVRQLGYHSVDPVRGRLAYGG